MDVHKRLELEAAAREEGSDIFYEAADEIARLRDELEAARLDADMQAREVGNMEYNSRVLMTERDEALGLAKRHMDEKHRTQQQAAEDWDVLQQRIKTAEEESNRLRKVLKLAEDVLSRPPWSNNMLADGRHPHGVISAIRAVLGEDRA